jgi:hypothetical protein
MANKVRTGDRSNLKIADLMRRKPAPTKLMNVNVPGNILDSIERMADELDSTKTTLVIALLEAGLEAGGKVKKKK